MTLQPGARLGPYEVIAQIGVGGMGEVYQARDTRLKRDVALKVLPDTFAADHDRLARFQREAELLATLNHPHIAGIYGIEEADDIRALVLELVEGPTLADRIARGPIPIDEALSMARQIAEALEAAHEQSIIHRDLKPANIKVRPDGTVKVLDFGLAKLSEHAGGQRSSGPAPPSISPTVTSPMMTGLGVVLGTAAYMSPEQARGRPVDKRADIWAFGCLLYEMITGRRPFDGEDVASAIGAAIHKEPEWSAIPTSTPPALRATIARCLQKDPKLRARDIGDVRLAMDGAFGAGEVAAPPAQRSAVVRVATIAAVGAALAAGLLVWTLARPAPVRPVPLRFEMLPAEGTRFGNYFNLSPDGRSIAYTVVDMFGRQSLWVRSFESGESRELTRAGFITSSFAWSPDGRVLAFSNQNGLGRIDIAGGPPEMIASGPGWAGGAWAPDDTILFGRVSGSLRKIPAKGGTPIDVTTLDPARREIGHTNPFFLPDGRHFVYFRSSSDPANNGVFVGSLDAKAEDQPRERLIAATENAVYAGPAGSSSPGHLLYQRDGVLLAQPFDARTLALAGDPVQVADDVGVGPVTYSHVSVAAAGVLAYGKRQTAPGGTPTWFDRTGRELGTIGGSSAEHAINPRISPDGKRLALIVNGDVWVYDFSGRPPMRLTHLDRAGTIYAPLWTPDGQSIVYEPPGSVGLRAVASDGSVDTPKAVSPAGHYHPHGWSADGKEMLVVRGAERPAQGGDAWDILRIPAGASVEPITVIATPATEGFAGASLSPNKRFLAYVSDTTGANEVWVRPYPGPGPAERISPNGGTEPLWSSSGKELIYLEARRFMSVKIATDGAFTSSAPTPLFEAALARSVQPPTFDLAPDGRILAIKAAGTPPAPISVVVNWREAVKPAPLR